MKAYDIYGGGRLQDGVSGGLSSIAGMTAGTYTGDGSYNGYRSPTRSIIPFSLDLSTIGAGLDQTFNTLGYSPGKIRITAGLTTLGHSEGLSDGGGTNRCVICTYTGGGVYSDTSYLVRIFVDGTGLVWASAQDAAVAGGFKLTWSKNGSPTGTVNGIIECSP